MLSIDKSKEPDFFTSAKKKVDSPNQSDAWSSEHIRNISTQLREWIIDKSQQNKMCVYCEKKITLATSHTDHFKPRRDFGELTLDFKNLFVSCNSNNHCAKYKDSKKGLQKKDFLSLLSPAEIGSKFSLIEFTETGRITSTDKQIEDFLNDILNVNEVNLIEERKSILRNKEFLCDLSGEEIFESFQSHYNLIKQFFKFDIDKKTS